MSTKLPAKLQQSSKEAMGPRSYRRDEYNPGRCTSNSENSASSDSESSDGSDVSSDDLDLGLTGKSEAQRKFRRLRRIFLNRPAKVKQPKKERRKTNARGRDAYRLDQNLTRSSRHRRRGISISSSSSEEDNQHVATPNSLKHARRPLQDTIEQHLHTLEEQMKRHSAQRDSAANQAQNMLEQAVDELRFLQKQEERAMESQVRIIRESYSLRLEVFQQQYLSQVAEIEDEMYASIQKRKEECDATILAAAKRIQEQTQLTLRQDLPAATGSSEVVGEKVESSSISTSSSSTSKTSDRTRTHVRRHQRDPLSSPRVAPMPKQTSPVSRQRAKLQALQDKLAAFSPESLSRVRSELAIPNRQGNAERLAVSEKRTASTTRSLVNFASDRPASVDEWQPSPLSPVRRGPSYWKNGISLATKQTTTDEVNDTTARRKGGSATHLNRRFLRPEEEEELQHLRTSIGLAKDWMTMNSCK